MSKPIILAAALSLSLAGGAHAAKEAQPAAPGAGPVLTLKAPLFSSAIAAVPAATVNGEVITVKELSEALSSAHESREEGKAAGRTNLSTILNRLINLRLIRLEAENMGFHELPEVKKGIEEYAAVSLRDELKRQQVKELTPDPKEVERLYREAVKELKIRSVKFDKEEDAKELARKVQAGGDFLALIAPLVEAGKVEGGKESEFVSLRSLLPQVAEIVSTVTPGAVSQVIPVGPAFAIVKVEDVRFPEGNAEALEAAQQQALQQKRVAALTDLRKDLMTKFVKRDDKLIAALDFEAAEPGYAKLLTDKRVVAEITGEKPVTVGELADAMSKRFFHGTEQAIKEKRVNEQKVPALETILYERIYTKEAVARGLDRSESYVKNLEEFRNSLIFGMFIQKVIAPEIKITKDELVAYYKEHISEYSSPAVMRLVSIPFTKKEHAEKALAALRKGTDFQWLRANSDGQADAGNAEILKFDGNPLIVPLLPEKIRTAVAGAKTGDGRLYSSPEGYHYLLFVKDATPEKPAPFEKEQAGIEKKVFNIRMTKSIEEWAGKLKKEYPVVIFASEVGA